MSWISPPNKSPSYRIVGWVDSPSRGRSSFACDTTFPAKMALSYHWRWCTTRIWRWTTRTSYWCSVMGRTGSLKRCHSTLCTCLRSKRSGYWRSLTCEAATKKVMSGTTRPPKWTNWGVWRIYWAARSMWWRMASPTQVWWVQWVVRRVPPPLQQPSTNDQICSRVLFCRHPSLTCWEVWQTRSYLWRCRTTRSLVIPWRTPTCTTTSTPTHPTRTYRVRCTPLSTCWQGRVTSELHYGVWWSTQRGSVAWPNTPSKCKKWLARVSSWMCRRVDIMAMREYCYYNNPTQTQAGIEEWCRFMAFLEFYATDGNLETTTENLTEDIDQSLPLEENHWAILFVYYYIINIHAFKFKLMIKDTYNSNLDVYNLNIVEDLLASSTDWRNIQDIVRLSIRGLYDAVKHQTQSL